jgi:hypothetical protein
VGIFVTLLMVPLLYSIPVLDVEVAGWGPWSTRKHVSRAHGLSGRSENFFQEKVHVSRRIGLNPEVAEPFQRCGSLMCFQPSPWLDAIRPCCSEEEIGDRS